MMKSFKVIIYVVFLLSISNLSLQAKNPSPGVNRYAWSAALTTINFMSLKSADPFGGVIITNWYNVGTSYRYKLNVYVLTGILNSQTVAVRVFKQRLTKGRWVSVKLDKLVDAKLENAILNEAHKLRSSDSQ